ncbi:MAG: hypothetical protein ACOYWZ_14200 [Bacillota bacterium]
MDYYKLKKRLLEWYIHNSNLLNTGIGLLYTPKQIVQYIVGISIVVKLFIDPAMIYYFYILVGVGVLFVIGGWFIGWWWDKSGAYHMAAEWSNKRNPFVKNVYNKINEVKNGSKNKKT